MKGAVIKSMSNLKNQYEECKNYSENIIDKITTVLDENNMKYKVKSKGKEIVVTMNGQSKNAITDTIYKNVDISKMVFTILIDIVQIGDELFIRQQTK